MNPTRIFAFFHFFSPPFFSLLTYAAIKNSLGNKEHLKKSHIYGNTGITGITGIAVGGGPSGPSIEGPFCRAVHLYRSLRDRKKAKKKRKKIKK